MWQLYTQRVNKLYSLGDKGAGILAKCCLNNNETTKLEKLSVEKNSLTSEGMKHVMKIVTSELYY